MSEDSDSSSNLLVTLLLIGVVIVVAPVVTTILAGIGVGICNVGIAAINKIASINPLYEISWVNPETGEIQRQKVRKSKLKKMGVGVDTSSGYLYKL